MLGSESLLIPRARIILKELLLLLRTGLWFFGSVCRLVLGLEELGRRDVHGIHGDRVSACLDLVKLLRLFEILRIELFEKAAVVINHDVLEVGVKTPFRDVALSLDANGEYNHVLTVVKAGCDAAAEAVDLSVLARRVDNTTVLLDLPDKAVHDRRILSNKALADIAVLVRPPLVVEVLSVKPWLLGVDLGPEAFEKARVEMHPLVELDGIFVCALRILCKNLLEIWNTTSEHRSHELLTEVVEIDE